MNLTEREHHALIQALRALKKRDYLRGELQSWLAARQFQPDEVDAALNACVRWGFLDDNRTGADLADSLWSRGYGTLKIRHDLERKGATSDVIEAIISEFDVADERQRALAMIAKRFDRKDSPAKAARYLGGRGFEEELVTDVIEGYFDIAPFE
jgi:regulatory protein